MSHRSDSFLNVSSAAMMLVALSLLTSCKDKTEPAPPAVSLLEPFYQSDSPKAAKHISEIFSDPTPGNEIVVAGEVMGRLEPFIDGRAMVVLGDPTQITPCNRIPGDLCPTPWDVCCDDPEVIKKSVATIQFLDTDGRVIKQGLKGFEGITELSYLTVAGTIAEGSNPNNLLITANSFHVSDPSPFKDAKPVADSKLDGEIFDDGEVFIFTKRPKTE